MSLSAEQEEGLRRLLASKAEYVIGIDEVGIGAWAGPAVVAGAVFTKGWGHPDVKDSKTYTHSRKQTAHDKRRRVLVTIIEPMVAHKAICVSSSEEIDKIGMGEVQAKLVEQAIDSCVAHYPNSVVVVDGITKIRMQGIEMIAIPKADSLIPAVSAASIIAKVFRDQKMMELAKKYPGYFFEMNVGYGTPNHQVALKKLGVCAIHRKSYRPIQDYLAST